MTKARPPVCEKGIVTVHSLPACPHCKAAKELLAEYKIPFKDISYDKSDPIYPTIRDELVAITKMNTFPMIYFGARLVGGNSDLQELAAKKQLMALARYEKIIKA